MVLYLTSSFIPYQEVDTYEKKGGIDNCGFFEDLKNEWPATVKLLYVPCDSNAAKENEHQLKRVLDALEASGLGVEEIKIMNEDTSAEEQVNWADVIYLAGGHAPTQLAFMNRMHLRDALRNYDGIIIGLSAGSVNSAFYVYHMPELEGEAVDPNFRRFTDGLDLTNIQIIPHRDDMLKKTIDGLSFINDIVLPDSYGCRFFMISDGSYFKVKDGVTTFSGEGEVIEDGEICPLKEGIVVPYMSHVEQPVVKSIISEGYDMIFTVEKNDQHCEVYYIKKYLEKIFENSHLKYHDICNRISEFIVKEERESYLKELDLTLVKKEMAEKGNFVRTVHINTPDGVRVKNIRARNVAGYPDWIMLIYVDITTILDHDWMTDEYARTGFMDRAKLFVSELRDEDKYSLVYANVKGFKAVNELFGNQRGDLLIFQTRDILRDYLKPVILGRLESDHFALITSDEYLTEKNLKKMCHQIFRTDNIEYSFEIQCGIFPLTHNRLEMEQALAGAKLAENNVRSSNKNVLFEYHDDSMKEVYVQQQFLLADFERALEENEFEPYYQPIVNAKTGEIVSAEMLIRWRHKELGMVSPGLFIPIIESEGKTPILDKFMVKCGIEFIEKRISEGKKIVPCAINLSRVDFYDAAFIERIFNYIKEKKIDLSMVRFEVTESAYADLETKALEYLNEMKKQGIQILLDDYGSGMSSLSMLETFDFDIIKLDIGFIRKIGINQKVESIIISTIKLAHSIGAKVTAEGVETEEQLQFLRNAECDYIQGFYFYKPVDEKSFGELLD